MNVCCPSRLLVHIATFLVHIATLLLRCHTAHHQANPVVRGCQKLLVIDFGQHQQAGRAGPLTLCYKPEGMCVGVRCGVCASMAQHKLVFVLLLCWLL